MTIVTQDSARSLREYIVEVGRVVHSVLSTYLDHCHYPDDVNSGGCFTFAGDVVEAMPDEYTATVLKDNLHMHGFVYVEETDRFYDSTAPYGVTRWQDLAFYVDKSTHVLETVTYPLPGS